MSTIITHGAGTITPEVVDGYEAVRQARSIVHNIIGRPDPDVTFRPAGLRSGTLSLVFATSARAHAAASVLAVPGRFNLTDVAVPEVSMAFVVAGGEISVQLDSATRTVWTVTIPFQEVRA